RRSLRPNVPRVAQGRLLWRREHAEVALLASIVEARLVLGSTLVHALEARLTARRRHQLEPLGRRGRPGLVRCERLRPFAPRLRRLRRRSLRPDEPRVAQGRLLRRCEHAEVALLAILATLHLVPASILDHALEARRTAR
ncbi:hypothetical protein Ctob_010389, partial [Chrysochromulina tobinii]